MGEERNLNMPEQGWEGGRAIWLGDREEGSMSWGNSPDTLLHVSVSGTSHVNHFYIRLYSQDVGCSSSEPHIYLDLNVNILIPD